MKKLTIIAALGLLCAATFMVNAQATADDKATRKELIKKYDTNGDKKLDKDEIAKMSADDKAKWDKLPKHGGKKADKDATTTSTNSVPATK